MNKTKIEWTKGDSGEQGYTWNPVTGCYHNCDYCYARRMTGRFGGSAVDNKDKTHCLEEQLHKPDGEVDPFPFDFEPTLYKYKLNEPKHLRKPSRIFTVSMGDLFGEWVPDSWIENVLQVVKECPQHTFMFLTKNPNKYYKFIDQMPKNAWLGASADNPTDARCITDTFSFIHGAVKFLSIEPLLHDVADYIDYEAVDWIIVGAQTGPKSVRPRREWIEKIINNAQKYNVPLFLKNNLKWEEQIQEFPLNSSDTID